MVSLTASSILDSGYHDRNYECSQSTVKMAELNEITNFIMLSQVLARSSFTERLGLPSLGQATDLNSIMQIDGCLNRLETSFASFAVRDNAQEDAINDQSKQHFYFQLRYVISYQCSYMSCLMKLVLVT